MGVLGIMEQQSLSPNVVVLNSLISCLPYKAVQDISYHPDEFFVAVIKKLVEHYKVLQPWLRGDVFTDILQIKPDSAFNNALYKRNISCGIKGAEVIDVKTFDPYTWSINSKKCKTSNDVNAFFKLISESQVVPNQEIFYTLMRSVATWGARLNVLQKMGRYNISLNRSIIVQIEDEINKTRENIESLTPVEKNALNWSAFYKFQELYTEILDRTDTESVTTGDRKIFIDDVPEVFKPRKD